MRRQVRIRERLETWPPPLRKRIRNLPFIIDTFTGELRPRRCEAFVETRFEAFDFIFISMEVVAWSDGHTRQLTLQAQKMAGAR